MEENIRQIKPLSLVGIKPNELVGKIPEFRWIDPNKLFIEEKYQRNISQRSIVLIRKSITDWSWLKMKPPICSVNEDGKIVIIDGQHTAIAGASHPRVKKILIVVVDAKNISERAEAFLGHNKDRIQITSMQMFYASLVAGDPISIKVKSVCDKAKVNICKTQPYKWEVGDTVAIVCIKRLVAEIGEEKSFNVLKILRDARRAPVVQIEITAVKLLLYPKNGISQVNQFDLSTVIMEKDQKEWLGKAQIRSAQQKIKTTDALSIIWKERLQKGISYAGSYQENKSVRR